MSQPIFFEDSTVDSSAWKKVTFGFTTRNLIIISPDRVNTDDIYFSTDGSVIMGRLKANEPFNGTGKRNNSIYVKAKSGTQAYRIWGY